MKQVKDAVLKATILFAGVQAAPLVAGQSAPQFTSRVYFVIHESTPYLVQRGRKVIEKEFAETYGGAPQLQGKPYQVASEGNQVVFSMVADADMRTPFQSVVSEIVGQLNGRVRTRGGYDVLRTATEESPGKFLEVTLDDTNTKIVSIRAQAITLRNLLEELRIQFSEATVNTVAGEKPILPFSYMIDRDCAARELDWSFGAEPGSLPAGKKPPAKSVDEVITALATFFKFNVENHQGTYMFSGHCPRPVSARAASAGLQFLPSRWITLGPAPVAPPPPSAVPSPMRAPRPLPVVPVNVIE